MKVFRPTLSGSVIPVQALPLEERENRSSADKFESRTRRQIVPISNWGLASVCSTRSSLYMGKIVTRDPEILGGEPVRNRNRVLNLEKCLRQVMALMDGEDIVEFRKVVFDLFKARRFVHEKEQATF